MKKVIAVMLVVMLVAGTSFAHQGKGNGKGRMMQQNNVEWVCPNGLTPEQQAERQAQNRSNRPYQKRNNR